MKVTDKVFKLEATKGAYGYIVKGEQTFMIDTGLPKKTKGILSEIAGLGINKEEIKHILLTHNDVDHVGNAAQLSQETGATIWCSKTDIPFIMGEKQRYGVKKFVGKLVKYEKPKQISPLDSKCLPAGLTIIETPGHTPGHVCFLYEDVLFAGDLLMMSRGKLVKSRRVMTWDSEKVSESIKKVLQYKFKYICAAHMEPVAVNDEVLGSLRQLCS